MRPICWQTVAHAERLIHGSICLLCSGIQGILDCLKQMMLGSTMQHPLIVCKVTDQAVYLHLDFPQVYYRSSIRVLPISRGGLLVIFTPRNPSHNPTLENNTRSPRVALSLSPIWPVRADKNQIVHVLCTYPEKNARVSGLQP